MQSCVPDMRPTGASLILCFQSFTGRDFWPYPGKSTIWKSKLNRSLKQLTEDMQCPELYFFRHGNWVPNPHTPLAWTQANLALALSLMKKSVAVTTGSSWKPKKK